MPSSQFPRKLIAAFAFAGLASAPATYSQAADREGGYQASSLLPPRLVQSIHHRVLDDVGFQDGFFEFRVESNLGVYQVRSIPLLEIRVHEIETMAAALNQFEATDEELYRSIRGQRGVGSDSVVDILTDPVGTASKLASNLSTNLEDTVSGDYLKEQSQSVASGPAAYESPGPYKRSVAAQLYLDVYSSNTDVQLFLDRLALARSGGKLREVMATVSAPGAKRPSIGSANLRARVENLIKNNEPEKLRAINEARLRSLNLTGPPATRFLENLAISPRYQCFIVAYLGLLRGVDNLVTLLELAGDSSSEIDALAYQRLAEMLAFYHRRMGGLERLKSSDALPQAVSSHGALLYFLPVDHIRLDSDTERVLEYLATHADEAGYPERSLIVSGTVSGDVRTALAGRGIDLHERFLF